MSYRAYNKAKVTALDSCIIMQLFHIIHKWYDESRLVTENISYPTGWRKLSKQLNIQNPQQ